MARGKCRKAKVTCDSSHNRRSTRSKTKTCSTNCTRPRGVASSIGSWSCVDPTRLTCRTRRAGKCGAISISKNNPSLDDSFLKTNKQTNTKKNSPLARGRQQPHRSGPAFAKRRRQDAMLRQRESIAVRSCKSNYIQTTKFRLFCCSFLFLN